MLKKLLNYRILILIILIILTIGIALPAVRLRIDGSITAVLPEDDPDFQYNQQIEAQFGSTEEIVILVSCDENVYDPENLQAISHLTETLKSLDEVKEKEVISLITLALTIPGITNPDFGKGGEDLISAEMAFQIQEGIAANPLFSGKVVSEDSRKTVVTAPVSVNISYSDFALKELVSKLRNEIEVLREMYPHVQMDLSGHPIIQADIMQYMANDLLKLFPLAILVVMIILLFSLGEFKAMMVPIAVTFVSIAWTFGLKGILKSNITLTETVIPVILISLGCANGIHILSDFIHYSNRGYAPYLAVKKTMKQMALPVILTSITTALGFFSLIFSTGQSLRNMGMFLAFGVIIAMAFSLLFIPIILSFYKKKRKNPEIEKKTFEQHFRSLRSAERFTISMVRHPYILIIVMGVMLCMSVLGILKTEADTDEVRYFKETTPVRIVTEKIEESLGGISTVYIVLNGDSPDRFKEADILNAIDEIQTQAEQLDNVSYTMSVANYVKMIYYTFKKNDPEAYILPKNDILVNRMTDILSKDEAAREQMLSNYINEDFSKACLHVRMKNSNTRELKKVLAALEPILKESLPEDVSVKFAGDYIRIKNGDNIVRGQIFSLLATLGTILIVLSAIFTSPVVGFIVSIPVTIAVLFNFSVMWIFGVSLNPATAIIASVGLGVGVDYGIHYYSRFRNLYLKTGKYRPSIVNAVAESAKGILSNAVAVGIGFLVLLFSSYQIIFDIGWIIAVSMVTTAFLSLTILPVLLSVLRPKVPKRVLFSKFAEKTSEKAGELSTGNL